MRLFKMLDEEFGGSSGLTMAFWGTLLDDPLFVVSLSASLERGDAFDRPALMGAIAPHLHGLTAQMSAEETAGLIVDAIERLAPRAKSDLRDAMHYEFEMLRSGGARASLAPMSLSWAPRIHRDHLLRVAEESPEMAARLGEALQEEASRARTAASIVSEVPPWLREAPASVWKLLGSLLEAYGDLPGAIAALERAAARPTARPARLLAQAALLASRSDKGPKSAQLLKKARRLDAGDPALTLAEADALAVPEARLELLSTLRAEDPWDKAHAACLAAEAHTFRGDLPAALTALDEARAHAPDSLRVLEIEAVSRMMYAVKRIEAFGPDSPNLIAARKGFLDLATELEAFGRLTDGALLRARAAQCDLLLGDPETAAGHLAEVRSDLVPRWPTVAAAEIAMVLTDLGRADDALDLLKHVRGGGEVLDLARAEARIASTNGTRRRAGVAGLDKLIASADPAIRVRAAFNRQSLLADFGETLGVNPTAHAVLAEHDPALAALLSIAGKACPDRRSAEAVLLPHSAEPRVLHRLADLAAAEDEDQRAIDLIQAAADRTADPRVHLRRAYLLLKGGRGAEALADLAAMQERESLALGLRVQAILLEIDLRSQRLEWDHVERLARRWGELDPTAGDADWELVHARARLGRYQQALEHMDAAAMKPDTLGRAELAARVIYRAAEPLPRIERLIALSDRYGDESEAVELHLLLAAAAGGDLELPPQIAARIQGTATGFLARFPQSKALQVITLGEDLEGLKSFLAEQHARTAASRQELWRQVEDAEAPVAVVAGAEGNDVSTLWSRLTGLLPLGFAHPALDELELTDALAALGGPIVLDPAALVILGGLGPTITKAALTAFPGSVIAQSVLDDADRAAADAVLGEGETGRGFLGWDPERAQPRLQEMSREDAERDRARAQGVLALAHRLGVVPDVDPDRPHDLDESLADIRGGGRGLEAAATWPATHAVASRLGRPLYSDDRVVRRFARGEGGPTFGTAAVLDALVSKGLIPAELRDAARRRLWASGAGGLLPGREEILAIGRQSQWQLVPELAVMLVDQAPWRTDSAEALRRWLSVLEVVYAEAPERFDDWVARIVDAASRDTGQAFRALAAAQAMIVMAWRPVAPEGAPFRRALVRALRRAGEVVGFGDPLLGAFRELDRAWQVTSPQIAAALGWRAIAQLEAPDLLLVSVGITPFDQRLMMPLLAVPRDERAEPVDTGPGI